jgi:branched-chain amino acid transport system substrate-binding protein
MLIIGGVGPAMAAKIGLVIPLEGPFKQLGEQSRAGAEAAAALTGDRLVVVEDTCALEAGAFVGKTLADEKVDAAVGFLCLETLAAALPVLKGAKIPALTTAVRADSVTENKDKTGFLINRLSPRDDSEAAALAEFLLPEWSKRNFAIIDDGTIHARDMAEAFRQAAVEAGLKPVFTDTYRPGLINQAALARRLQKAGATHVFIGGDIEDAAVISHDAKKYGGLTIAVGESGPPSGEVAEYGPIMALTLPDLALRKEAAAAKIAIYAKDVEPDNYALLAYAAVEIASQAARTGAPAVLGVGPYETAIGPVTFNADGELAENPYRLELVGSDAASANGDSGQ